MDLISIFIAFAGFVPESSEKGKGTWSFGYKRTYQGELETFWEKRINAKQITPGRGGVGGRCGEI